MVPDDNSVVLSLEQIPWLHWLLKATPEHRMKWSIEPGGDAVYWEKLDNGFEVAHALVTEFVSDEELTLAAEAIFLDLDASEAEDV